MGDRGHGLGTGRRDRDWGRTWEQVGDRDWGQDLGIGTAGWGQFGDRDKG